MKLYTAPERVPPGAFSVPSVFLGGGISNCPEWQQQAIQYFKDHASEGHEITLFNPRRDGFDLANKLASEEQVRWERTMLERSSVRLFWFASGPSVQPITLLELGYWLGKAPGTVSVGIDPEYSREFDVHFQSALSSVTTWKSLYSTCQYAMDLCQRGRELREAENKLNA